MRQVTGNNRRSSANKVSIQLALDGHSFCLLGLDENYPDDQAVAVTVLTPRTLCVPRELFAPEAAAEILAAAGLPTADDDRIVWSDPEAEVVAVMAADRQVLDAVTAKLGERVRFTTPLLNELHPNTPSVWMLRTAGLLYIKVYEGSLRLCEVIATPADADVLYFTERLGAIYNLSVFTLCTAGPDARVLRKLIGKRFKNAVCEL